MPDTSGPSSSTPFAFYDPDSRSLRTSQGTFPWDSTESSVTLPPSGSMRSGALSERPTLGPATSASGCSSLLPTPAAQQAGGTPERHLERKNVLDGANRTKVTELSLFVQTLRLLPTPAVNDMGEGKTVEWWDEWTAKMQEAHGNGNGHGRSLAIEAMRLIPTPSCLDAKGPSPGHSGTTAEAIRDLAGATTSPPSTATPDSPDDWHQLPLTTEDG